MDYGDPHVLVRAVPILIIATVITVYGLGWMVRKLVGGAWSVAVKGHIAWAPTPFVCTCVDGRHEA